MSGSYYSLNAKYNTLLALINGLTPSVPQNLSGVLAVGNNAGTADIDMNNNDILLVNNIDLATINGSAYPPVVAVDTLSAVLSAGNNAGSSSIDMNTQNISNGGTFTATSFVGALTGNADSATTTTNIAGGLGGSIPFQSAVNTTSLLANGTAGQVLTSQGTTLAPIFATPASVNQTLNTQTASYTLVASDNNKRVIMNVASNNIVTVNSGVFSAGDSVFIVNSGVATTTITEGAGVVINSSSGLALEQYRSSLLLALSSTNFSLSLSAGILFVFPLNYLVIAGGGGGGTGTGATNGGGAGAGGYRCSLSGELTGGGGVAETPLGVRPTILYTITVGNGGAADTDGQNSSIVNTIDNITATGGGRGGGVTGAGGNGGSSGGGRGGNSNTLAGIQTPTPIQGNNGSNGGTASLGFVGGSGGGAGTASSNLNNIAGNGLFSSITGVSIQRGGGGAGGALGVQPSNIGGAGGGGNGSDGTISATAGVVNTGGGGGGGHNPPVNGASGGRGIVVLRTSSVVPTATLTGGGSFDGSVSGFKIYTFLTSGTITFPS